MNLKSLSLLLFSIFILQASAYAGIFKCVKKNGDVYYNDKPCTSGLKEKKLRLDRVPAKDARSRKNRELDQDQADESSLLQKAMKQTHYSPADQAKLLKKQEAAVREHELSVADGSYEMTAEEKKSLKIIEERQAKAEAELRRKEAIKLAKEKERNRLAVIEREKSARKVNRQLAKGYAKKRVSEYKKYMESKERSGAMMTEEEKNWRNDDTETTIKNARYHDDVNTVGTKAYKDRQQSMQAAGYAKQRRMKREREFNNTRYRYKGNDVHYR